MPSDLPKRSPFAPIRKREIDTLRQKSNLEFAVDGASVYRDSSTVHQIVTPSHVQRWFRVLTNAEATAASTAGFILQAGLTSNVPVRRTMPAPIPPATSTEAEPSVWAIEVFRKQDNTYADLIKRYELIRFPGFSATGSLADLGTAITGQRVLAFFNEATGRWESDFIGELTGVQTETTFGFVRVCDPNTNSCCLLDGTLVKFITGETTDWCDTKRCFKKIWVTCVNRQLPASSDIPVAGMQNFCDWGQFLGVTAICAGDEREVYAVRCGDCECNCPTEFIHAKFTSQDPACPFDPVAFTMRCVEQNPISLTTVGAGNTGWWGEWTMSGFIPAIGHSFNLLSPITVEGDSTIDVVWVTYAGADDLCDDSLYRVWALTSTAGWVDITDQSFETTDDDGQSDMITDNEEPPCAIMYPMSLRYGLYVECHTSSGTLIPVAMYMLKNGSFASAGVLDPCSNLIVPQNDDDLSEANGVSTAGPCCDQAAVLTTDAVLSTLPITCTISIPGDTGTNTYPDFDPLPGQMVISGCQCWWRTKLGGDPYPLICCENTETGSLGPRFYLTWDLEECAE